MRAAVLRSNPGKLEADGPQRLSQDGAAMFQFFNLSSFAELMLVHESMRAGEVARSVITFG